jgi:hypothetical protein
MAGIRVHARSAMKPPSINVSRRNSGNQRISDGIREHEQAEESTQGCAGAALREHEAKRVGKRWRSSPCDTHMCRPQEARIVKQSMSTASKRTVPPLYNVEEPSMSNGKRSTLSAMSYEHGRAKKTTQGCRGWHMCAPTSSHTARCEASVHVTAIKDRRAERG